MRTKLIKGNNANEIKAYVDGQIEEESIAMPPRMRKIQAQQTVDALLRNHGSIAAAAREQGITRQSMRDRIRKNPYVKTELEKRQQKMDKLGATFTAAIKAMVRGVTAKKVVGESSDDFMEVDDHPTQLRAAEQILKARGDLLLVEKEPPPEQHVHFHFKDKNTNELHREIMLQLTERNKSKS